MTVQSVLGKIMDSYNADVLTLDACLVVGGWFSSGDPVDLGSGLLVEVLVSNVHIVDRLWSSKRLSASSTTPP